MTLRTILCLTACLAATAVADAATTNVPFAGTVISTCTLAIGTPGVLAPSSDYKTLGSTQPGGTSGSVTVISTGSSFRISADAPSSFAIAPADGNTNVSFVARYQATGATTIGQTIGSTATTLLPGLTTLGVDLTATKSAGVFSQGLYQTEVIVRCE